MTAWIALGAAALFILQSERRIANAGGAVRAFDASARATADALGDVRASQQAYVAAGQDGALWMRKVATITDTVTTTLGELHQIATDPATRTALDQATNTLAIFEEIDKRARDYLKSRQALMAADVIFTEGGEAAATAGRSIEAARVAERVAVDRNEAAIRRTQAYVVSGAAAIVAMMVLALLPIGHTDEAADERRRLARLRRDALPLSLPAAPVEDYAVTLKAEPVVVASDAPPIAVARDERVDRGNFRLTLDIADAEAAASAAPAAVARRTVQGQMLKHAADLATEFGRARDLDDVSDLLGRAASAMDATGVVVWLGSLHGDDLRPLLAHGYSSRAVSRMPAVARSEDNAAAAAYRSGRLQLVMSTPESSGAIVAPIFVPGGCIGALSAEFRGAETSDSVQALATIVAANLASVLAAGAESADLKAAGM